MYMNMNEGSPSVGALYQVYHGAGASPDMYAYNTDNTAPTPSTSTSTSTSTSRNNNSTKEYDSEEVEEQEEVEEEEEAGEGTYSNDAEVIVGHSDRNNTNNNNIPNTNNNSSDNNSTVANSSSAIATLSKPAANASTDASKQVIPFWLVTGIFFY